MLEPEDGTVAERKRLFSKGDWFVNYSGIMNVCFRRCCAKGSRSAGGPISDPPGVCHPNGFSRTGGVRFHNLRGWRKRGSLVKTHDFVQYLAISTGSGHQRDRASHSSYPSSARLALLRRLLNFCGPIQATVRNDRLRSIQLMSATNISPVPTKYRRNSRTMRRVQEFPATLGGNDSALRLQECRRHPGGSIVVLNLVKHHGFARRGAEPLDSGQWIEALRRTALLQRHAHNSSAKFAATFLSAAAVAALSSATPCNERGTIL